MSKSLNPQCLSLTFDKLQFHGISVIYTLLNAASDTSTAIQEKHKSFRYKPKAKAAFAPRPTVSTSVVRDRLLILSGSTTWCNHHQQIRSQGGGSLISSKVSAIRPTLPSQRTRPHPQRT